MSTDEDFVESPQTFIGTVLMSTTSMTEASGSGRHPILTTSSTEHGDDLWGKVGRLSSRGLLILVLFPYPHPSPTQVFQGPHSAQAIASGKQKKLNP